jgi:ADP-ribosylglycohydrolase
LGISAAMASALSQDPGLALGSILDGEPLPRVAIAAAFGFGDRRSAIRWGAELAQLTHPGEPTLHAACVYAAWVVAALEGRVGEHLLSLDDVDGIAIGAVLSDAEIARLQTEGWSAAEEMIVEGARRGDALGMLRLTYAALLVGKTFKEVVLAVVNGGGHSDVAGATVGALAGACYGASSLPEQWLAVLSHRDEIEARADRLLVSSLTMMLEVTTDIAI